MQKTLLEALAIDEETTPVIAIVGGGGKTSLIFRLMEEFAAGLFFGIIPKNRTVCFVVRKPTNTIRYPYRHIAVCSNT